MLVPSLVALVVGGLLAALWLAMRAPGSAVAAVAWLVYALYEYLMHARVLCSGECNIRVDLLLLWPLLAGIALSVPVRMLVRRLRSPRKG